MKFSLNTSKYETFILNTTAEIFSHKKCKTHQNAKHNFSHKKCKTQQNAVQKSAASRF
jgi:hypothetical protein